MEMWKRILDELAPYQAQLVAVSKTKPVEQIQALYDLGQRDFGENRVQELVEKAAVLPPDIRWHLIGHLQTNKVKYIAPFVHLIHSVDSPRLLQEIEKQARQEERQIGCLLQFKIAEEETKYGLELETAVELLESDAFAEYTGVRIEGVMGMATFTEEEEQVRREFKNLSTIFQQLKNRFFADDPAFRTISMGMSGDYPIALEEGSTMVRIGSVLFGVRG
ncbi:MAG: YggS family pyridoxal phosphate-dependent enzyme [Phaeodactylibacter sp.]|nr:YggS family pyridoxal phosphate-dependent enzyme [Phaeodactylibacter sp.]